jgi:hypothetical protein
MALLPDYATLGKVENDRYNHANTATNYHAHKAMDIATRYPVDNQ